MFNFNILAKAPTNNIFYRPSSKIETHFRLVNNTDTDIVTTYVSGYDNDEWIGSNRIDNNFSGAFISSGNWREEREDINEDSSDNSFTMTLKFRDGTSDIFRINMRYATGDSSSRFDHRYRSHNMYYRRSGNTLIVTVENTEAQKSNNVAKQRIKEGEGLIKQKRYEEAIKKFDEAMNKANESSTINQINYNRNIASDALEKKKKNDEAIRLNNEGLDNMRNRDYKTAKTKYQEALNLANESATISLIEHNMKAAEKEEIKLKIQQLNDEAKEEVTKGNYLVAIQKYEHSLQLADDVSMVNTIKINKSEALNQFGKQLLQGGLKLESDTSEDKSEEAKNKFKRAEETFQLAESLHHTSQHEADLRTIKLKIEANEVFNEAIGIESEAVKLYEGSNYAAAQKKYEEASKKYEEAKKKFEEGMIFEENVKVVEEQISELKVVIGDIEKIELRHNIGKIHVTETTEEGSCNREEHQEEEEVSLVT